MRQSRLGLLVVVAHLCKPAPTDHPVCRRTHPPGLLGSPGSMTGAMIRPPQPVTALRGRPRIVQERERPLRRRSRGFRALDRCFRGWQSSHEGALLLYGRCSLPASDVRKRSPEQALSSPSTSESECPTGDRTTRRLARWRCIERSALEDPVFRCNSARTVASDPLARP